MGQRLDWWFTLDPSDANFRRMVQRKPGVLYHAAMPDIIPTPEYVMRYERLALTGRDAGQTEPRPRHTPEWWAWRWAATPRLCEIKGKIHTGNSVWGALQLVFQQGYKKIILVGVDADNRERVEGGKPNNLSHLPWLFRSAMPQLYDNGVKVIDTSINGHLNCFEKMSFEQALTWNKEFPKCLTQ
jgi:hypothetical protein